MEKSETSFNKRIVVFLPISVPGSGKSYLMSHFKAQLKEKYNGELHVISSDVLRKNLMDAALAREPTLSKDELFSKTSKRALHHFNEELIKLLKTISQNGSKELNFLFIDKNNLPNALPKVLENLEDKCSSLFDQWRFVALYPESFKPHFVSNKLKYPFSLNFMMNCLQRVQSRKECHETLNGQGYKSANILFSFINAYRNFSLDSQYIINEYHMHSAIKMPMTLENKESNEQFDQELIDLFNEIIREDNPRFDTEKNKQKVEKFLEVFEAKNIVFQQVSLENIKIFLEGLVDHCYDLFEKKINLKEKINFEEEKIEKTSIAPVPTPQYLSISATNQKYAQNTIEDFILSTLKSYILKNPAAKIVEDDLKNFQKCYQFPKILHVTTLYIGGDKKKLQTENFKLFKEGVIFNIEIEAIVYVPERIICGICFFDEKNIKIENHFPHLTMMTSLWKPKNSNDVLQALFNNHKSPLCGMHSQTYFRDQKTIEIFIPELVVNLGRKTEKVSAYVLKGEKSLILEGETKYEY